MNVGAPRSRGFATEFGSARTATGARASSGQDFVTATLRAGGSQGPARSKSGAPAHLWWREAMTRRVEDAIR